MIPRLKSSFAFAKFESQKAEQMAPGRSIRLQGREIWRHGGLNTQAANIYLGDDNCSKKKKDRKGILLNQLDYSLSISMR